MTAVAMDTAPPRAAAVTLGERQWRVAAIALLSVRFIQGFIYWGGGSRRFIYGPVHIGADNPSRNKAVKLLVVQFGQFKQCSPGGRQNPPMGGIRQPGIAGYLY